MRSRVAVQGDVGCFSETAARKALGDGVQVVSCRTFEDVARQVRSGATSYGVLPVDNSIAGPVAAARAVLEGGDLVTISELQLPIEQCLLVLPGSPIVALRRVISHPVALAQCGVFLARYPAMIPQAVWDTAGAAREVLAEQEPLLAAIAGREAAAHYGLEVAAAGIGDRADNFTTFVVVTKR